MGFVDQVPARWRAAKQNDGVRTGWAQGGQRGGRVRVDDGAVALARSPKAGEVVRAGRARGRARKGFNHHQIARYQAVTVLL